MSPSLIQVIMSYPNSCNGTMSESGFWNGKVGRSKKLNASRYVTEVRPLSLDWIQDPRKMGSPFPEQISQVSSGTSELSTWEVETFSF
jgi:hypothetical protein